jgi:hypothetical protein
MILLTKLSNPCPNCKLVHNVLMYGIEWEKFLRLYDADTPDGLALAAYYEITTVPALINDDEIITDVNKIIERLRG